MNAKLKIKPLVKYELINIKRGILIWIIAIFYAVGVQQSISGIYFKSGSSLTLVGLIQFTWLPLNFIMLPIIILSMKIGQSDNDIFKITDISPKEKMLSKMTVISIIDGIVFAANIILFIIVGTICRVSISYFLYESVGYIVNTLICLIVCSSLGLLIGQVISRRIGDVLSFILIILIFIILCNFYKFSNIFVPLINMRAYPGSFDTISYNMGYLYHNLFWITAAFIFYMITLLDITKKEIVQRPLVVHRCFLILAGIVCVYLAAGIYSMKPVYYEMTGRMDARIGHKLDAASDEKYSRNNSTTFFIKSDCGYYISSYIMNIDFDNKINNDCNMEIKITKDNIDSIELGLYDKLNILKLSADGKKLNYKRTGNSFIVSLPREYKKGEIINMDVSYYGIIKTTWQQGQELFIIRNNAMYLADVFEWYPKLNDSMIKEYKLNIKYNSKNKIYSNLNETYNSGKCIIEGKDKEVCLISGNIIERKYKGFLLVGNEEYINNNQDCDEFINIITQDKLSTKKFMLIPFTPGGTKMDEQYINAKVCVLE